MLTSSVLIAAAESTASFWKPLSEDFWKEETEMNVILAALFTYAVSRFLGLYEYEGY